VTIPAHLRHYAGLTRECTVIGQGSRIEVWDTESWNRWLAEHEQAYSDTSEEVIPGLI
jgi:MraZ protein